VWRPWRGIKGGRAAVGTSEAPCQRVTEGLGGRDTARRGIPAGRGTPAAQRSQASHEYYSMSIGGMPSTADLSRSAACRATGWPGQRTDVIRPRRLQAAIVSTLEGCSQSRWAVTSLQCQVTRRYIPRWEVLCVCEGRLSGQNRPSRGPSGREASEAQEPTSETPVWWSLDWRSNQGCQRTSDFLQQIRRYTAQVAGEALQRRTPRLDRIGSRHLVEVGPGIPREFHNSHFAVV